MTQAMLVTPFRHLCLEVKPQDENIRFQIRSTQILRRHTYCILNHLLFSHPLFTTFSENNVSFVQKRTEKTVPNLRLLR